MTSSLGSTPEPIASKRPTRATPTSGRCGRAPGWPDGKVLAPGVVAHTTNIVEHPELVAQRIANYARLLGRENVIAGTDCGFSQGAFNPRVHPSIMWAKLEALVEGAALASQRLWG